MKQTESPAIRAIQEIKKAVIGKDDCIIKAMTAILAGGHILIEDVPGVGKTTLALAFSKALHLEQNRIQFTPDVLPGDVTGFSLYQKATGTFVYQPGAVMCNLLLADEINRASPRTQSALLEAMNERQVSIEGKELKLIKPFLVIATQNPIEYYGTYPLPEAQLDRFAIRLSLGYPDEESELQILKDRRGNDPLEALQPVLDCDEIRRIQEEVRTVEIEDSLADYMMQVIRATRESNEIRLGASPRALLMLSRCAQSMAWLDSRMFVKPDDILALIQPLLAHRLVMTLESKHAGITPAMVLEEIVKKIRIPV